MSVTVMSYIWKNCKQSGSKKLMLLAIADNANDDGFAFPSIDTLAKKTCMSRRNAQKVIDYLESEGELRIFNRTAEDNPKINYSNVYQIPLSEEKELPNDIRGVFNLRQGGSVTADAPLVSRLTVGSVTADSGVVSPVTPESSYNRHNNDQINHQKNKPLIIPQKEGNETGYSDLAIAIGEFKKLEPDRPSVVRLEKLLSGGKIGLKSEAAISEPVSGDEFRAFVIWYRETYSELYLSRLNASDSWVRSFNSFRDDGDRYKNALAMVEKARTLKSDSQTETQAETPEQKAKIDQAIANFYNAKDSLVRGVRRG